MAWTWTIIWGRPDHCGTVGVSLLKVLSVVDLVDEDAEEGGRLFVWVWQELGLDLDDECRSHSREQAIRK